MTEPLGIWMVGALGGVGTSMVVGARAISRGLVSDAGLVTNRPEFAALDLVPLPEIVFGGHEVRHGTFWDSAYEIYKRSASFDFEVLQELKEDLLDISEALKPGTSVNAGEAIEDIVENPMARLDDGLRSIVQRIQSDIRSFRARESVEDVVVVNLASTEPPIPEGPAIGSPEELERLLDEGDTSRIRPSMLYSYAAFLEGCGYINFTPSESALCPVMQEIGTAQSMPFMGNDGKTGETLVKAALAPMFKHRNLRVLSWQGYNMLGDRDGQILSNPENLRSKVDSKDSVLQEILGYPLHTKVGIDFVESLDDCKTAWDFIHFQGFLDRKMSMQFTWQGVDSILAAPLVLDMARLTHLAMRRGESGPMRQLGAFFKSPLDCDDHDLHRQYDALLKYYGGLEAGDASEG